MTWIQHTITLGPHPRGFHLVTDELVAPLDGLQSLSVGLAHFFIQHTSASLALNENADANVRGDLERWMNHNIRENEPYYVHTYEGADDMPAHIKAVLIGPSLLVPISDGRLNLGTWQGIYLCEHRDRGGGRRVVVTLQGA